MHLHILSLLNKRIFFSNRKLIERFVANRTIDKNTIEKTINCKLTLRLDLRESRYTLAVILMWIHLCVYVTEGTKHCNTVDDGKLYGSTFSFSMLRKIFAVSLRFHCSLLLIH